METNKIPARADVPEKDKWAIQDLFATDDDWRAAECGDAWNELLGLR